MKVSDRLAKKIFEVIYLALNLSDDDFYVFIEYSPHVNWLTVNVDQKLGDYPYSYHAKDIFHIDIKLDRDEDEIIKDIENAISEVKRAYEEYYRIYTKA